MRKIFVGIAGVILSAIFCKAQNVGVGTTVPTEKLHVNGNTRTDTLKSDAIKVTPNAGLGKVMTSDATGNGSWQNMTASAPGGVGFGGWGDCSVQNISGFNPVIATDGVNGDFFGSSVAISGNFAIVGARNDQIGFFTGQGSAHIYFFNGTNWVHQQKLTAGDGAPSDGFGSDVSISGNFAIVGAPLDDNGANTNQGSVYFFFYNGTTWVQTQKIEHFNGGPNDSFGASVCMKGNTVIIGAPFDDIGANNSQGSADIYIYNGSSWIFQERLTANDGAASDRFGHDVSIDGLYAFAGAPFDNISPANSAGSVYQFFHNGSNWIFQAKLVNPSLPGDGHRFGTSVSVSGSYCVIGEPYHSPDNNRGAAYIFRQAGAGWEYHQRLNPPFSNAGNGEAYTGMSVAMSGDYAILVAPYMAGNILNRQGRFFIYRNISGVWFSYEDFDDPSASPNESEFMYVAIDNNRFALGIPQAPDFTTRGKVIFGKIE